jgi:hypothetical protein
VSWPRPRHLTARQWAVIAGSVVIFVLSFVVSGDLSMILRAAAFLVLIALFLSSTVGEGAGSDQ